VRRAIRAGTAGTQKSINWGKNARKVDARERKGRSHTRLLTERNPDKLCINTLCFNVLDRKNKELGVPF